MKSGEVRAVAAVQCWARTTACRLAVSSVRCVRVRIPTKAATNSNLIAATIPI